MSEPIIASRQPFAAEALAGTIYGWCACGRSARQPSSDGSHQGTEFTPVKYQAHSPGRLWFCGCKRSGRKPLCDGSHKRP